jgi:halocyanin-like protein
MDSSHTDVYTRRSLLQAGGAAAVGVAAGVGTAAAQQETVESYLSDVGNYTGSLTDETGSDQVTVDVGAEANGGAFGFGPAAIRVDPGTTVTWEWTGEGGGHNVVAEDETFNSGQAVAEAGTTFDHTFEAAGVWLYFCVPHKALGMKGAVVVGDVDVETGGDGAEEGGAEEGGAEEGGGGQEGGGGGEASGADASATAADRTGMLTIASAVALGLLSPLIFALVLKRKLGGQRGPDTDGAPR